MKSLRGTFQSMHVRNFRLFFTGQLISQGGTWMQTIALNWLVLHLSHNNGFLVGLAVALQFTPTLLFGVWGGAIADRFDKRQVLLCTQVAMAVVAVLLAIVDLTGIVQLWMLYVLVFAYGLALAVDNPTRQSFVSELVPPADLPNAIGLSSAIFQLARVLGPALAGVLIVAGGTGICFVLNSVSFLFVIGALLMMRPEELHRAKPLGREKGQLTEGLRYVWHTAELRWILLLMLVVGTFAINSPVVLPLLAKITFDRGPEVYSWMSIAMGAGAMFGALFAANRADVRGRLLYSTGMVFGVSIVVAALAPTLGLFIGVLVIVGGGQIAFLSTTNSALQLISEPSMRGRVMAVYTITLLGTTPIGGPLVGWVSDAFGPRWGFAIGGIATVIGVLVFGTAFLRARHQQRATEAVDGVVLGVDGEAIPASVS
jgi:MFS family permease